MANLKITLEIEFLPNGKWGLDMTYPTLGGKMLAYVTLAYGENLTEEQTERKIADAVQAIMAQLEPAHDEFPSASVGPEVAL